MSHYIVRDARTDEREKVRALTELAYEEFKTVMEPSAWEGFEGAMNSVLHDSGDATCIVADDEGQIIGSVFLYPGGSSAYSSDEPLRAPEFRLLAVSPRARGRGVGRALVDECVRRARIEGASELGLHTSKSFTAAIAMYEEMGFTRAPERDFQPPGAELIMGYRLPL